MTERPVVLFLCTGNSARSIMGEAILRHLDGRGAEGGRFTTMSAGIEPKGLNPLTLRVLAEKGIDTAGLSSKSSEALLGRVNIAHAITVCDNAAQRCPSFPFALQRHHWPFEDPATATGTEEERLAVFRRVRDRIEARVREWLEENPG